MPDTKAEEIKEVLKTTMNLDTIEEQLKEKTSKETNPKEQKDTKEFKTPVKQKSVLNDPYPNIKLDAEKEKKKRNSSLNIIIGILVLVCFILLYLLSSQTTIEEEKTTAKVEAVTKSIEKAIESDVKKEEISENTIIKTLTKEVAETPDKKEASLLVEKKIADKNNLEKNNEKLDTKTKQEVLVKTSSKIEEVKKLDVSPEIKEKQYNVISKEKTFKDYYNSTKYKKLTCYDFKAGTTRPTLACKKELKKFLTINKNAIRLEIIAVIGEDDIKIFEKLNKSIKVNKSINNSKLKIFMIRGLGRERVLETSWFVKETLGEDMVLTPTNYYVTSQKNNKGFLIKAYH